MKSFLQPIKRIIAANDTVRINVTGNLFLVWAADANVQIAWDDGSNPGTYGVGQGYQLDAGEEFKCLCVTNTSAAPNTVTIFAGTGTLLDFQKEISLSSATLTALAAAINASVELKLKIQTVAAGAAAVAYSNCKSLEVIAVGASGSVQIATASGTNYALAQGVGKEFSCETDNNHIETITITPSGTCGFEVTALYF